MSALGCQNVNTSPSSGESPGERTSAIPSGSRPPASPRVNRAAGYAWLFLSLAAAVYVLFVIVARLWLAAVAVFVALVVTALLRPVVDLFDRAMPRPLAVAASLIAAAAVILGLLTIVGVSVAGQASGLTGQFHGGLRRVTGWLRASPLHLRPQQVDHAVAQGRHWLTQHEGELAGHAASGAGSAAALFTGAILALFCAIFFLASGERMWAWCLEQIPGTTRFRWEVASRAGWATFQGYARATVLVAASNAALVAAALLILRVPLALPLALLVFLASFIPLVGGAFSLAVAALVTLAARGPVIALVVLILIPVLGQIEGHVLQPLIMSRSVRLHPVVVVVAVVCGGLLGGVIGAVIAVPLVAVAWSVVKALRDQQP
jgi:predicted PurR-regulated permease PerM